MSFFRGMLCAAAILVASGASAEPLQPKGQWVVNFRNAQCAASRAYGSPADPLTLALKKPVLGETVQLAVLRDGHYGNARHLEGMAQFSGVPAMKTKVLAYGSKRRVLLFNLPASELARYGAEPTLELRAKGELSKAFSAPELESVLKVLDQCASSLRAEWNVEENESAPKLKSRATGNLASFINDDDYPRMAVWKEEAGRVRFVLLVNEAGRVADCTVIETSGIGSLDAQSCAIMRERAQLTPATDMDGKPAKDALISSIRWMMPQ